MAQADGAVRIDTSLNNNDFNKGVDRMAKAMQNLSATTEKLGKTIDSAFNGYVKTLQNAGAAMRPIEAATSGIADKTEQLSGATDKAAESYGKVAQEANKAKAALSGVGDAGKQSSAEITQSTNDAAQSLTRYQDEAAKAVESMGKISLGDIEAQSGRFLTELSRLSTRIGEISQEAQLAERSVKQALVTDNPETLSEAKKAVDDLKARATGLEKTMSSVAETKIGFPAYEELADKLAEAESRLESITKQQNQLSDFYSIERGIPSEELPVSMPGGMIDEYKRLELEIVRTQGEISDLREAVRIYEDGDAFFTLSETERFQKLSAAAAELQSRIAGITDSFRGMRESENAEPTGIANLISEIESAEAELQDYQRAVSDMGTVEAQYGEWLNIDKEIDGVIDKVRQLRLGLSELQRSGDIDQTQYDELSARLASLVGDYDKLKDAVDESAQDAMPQYLKDWEEMPTLSGMVSDGFTRIRNSALTAVNAVQHPIQALDRGLALVAQSALHAGAALLKMASASIINGFRLIGESAAEAARQITKMTATAVSGGIKRLGAWLSNAAKSMTLFGRSAKRNNNVLKKSFSTILKYGLGVRSFYFLFRKIRQAIGEGYQNLARYSDTLNKSISGVISSFKRFENQFAASFEPLVNTIAPALTNLINSLTEGTYRVGEFIAALSGQKTVIRAKEIQEDYAASLKETKKAAKDAKNQLAGFDKLEILKEKDEHTDPNDMFETVPVEDEAKDFADAVKEAWVNVDLSGIGGTIGGKLKVALDKIPWPDIKKAVSDMGKRLSTFLNGLINVPELGASIGKSIAEAVNTAFAFLDGFAWNFDWKGLGNAIMDTVEAACDNLDWTLINHALQGLAIGLADLLNTIFSRKEVWEKIGVTVGEAINAAVLFGLTFLERFDFNQAASAIVAGLNAAVATIRFDNIGQLLGDLLGGALQFLYTAVTEFDWEKLGNQIAVGVNAFTSTVRRKIYDINWADMGTAIADGFNTAVVGIEWGGVGETVGMLFGGALTAVASFIRGLDYAEIVRAIQDFFSGAIQQVDFYDLITVWGVAALIVAVKKIIATHPVLAILVGAVLALGPELGNAIHKMVSDIPWEEVGATVGNAFLGALSRINDAIASVNWVEIGEAVGRFLGSINWLEIIGEVAELIMNVIAHGLELIAGVLIGLGPEKILKAIGVAVAAILAGVALMGIAGMILTAITPIIIGALTAIAGLLASPAIIVAAIATAIAGIITYLVTRKKDMEDAGEDVGNGFLYGVGKMFVGIFGWIKEHIFQPFIDAWRNLWQEHSPSKVMENEGGLIIAGLFNGISAAWHTITDFLGGALDGLKATLGNAWETISGAAETAWNGISTTLGGIVGGIASTIGDTWEKVKTATSDKWREVTTALGTTWESVKTAAGDKFKAVKETVSGAWDNIKANASKSLGEVSKTVSGKWGEMKTDASKAWDGLKTSVGQTLSGVKSESSSKIAEIVNDAKTKWERVKADASNAWNGVKSSIVPKAQEIRSQVASAFTSLQGTLSGVWGSIRSAASGALSSVSATVGSMVSSISSKVSSIQSTVRNVTSATSDALAKTASQMDALAKKNADNVIKINKTSGLASGGVVTNSGHIRSWYDSVRKYASGTLKAAGSLFVAGEAGPELVGHVNGRTEVLNQSQIASAIYGAVLSAMSEAAKTLGGFLSAQMATNTNALIAAIGQIRAPQQIAAPQDTALTERLAALQAVPYQVPAYATGTVMPYEVVAEIRRQTSELKTAIKDDIRAVVSAISNHGLAVTDAIRNIPVSQGQSLTPEQITRYAIDGINRRRVMMGKSPLFS